MSFGFVQTDLGFSPGFFAASRRFSAACQVYGPGPDGWWVALYAGALIYQFPIRPLPAVHPAVAALPSSKCCLVCVSPRSCASGVCWFSPSVAPKAAIRWRSSSVRRRGREPVRCFGCQNQPSAWVQKQYLRDDACLKATNDHSSGFPY
jgi:hypothetical protein